MMANETPDFADAWNVANHKKAYSNLARAYIALHDALAEMTDIADKWCVSGDCNDPIERAQIILQQPNN